MHQASKNTFNRLGWIGATKACMQRRLSAEGRHPHQCVFVCSWPGNLAAFGDCTRAQPLLGAFQRFQIDIFIKGFTRRQCSHQCAYCPQSSCVQLRRVLADLTLAGWLESWQIIASSTQFLNHRCVIILLHVAVASYELFFYCVLRTV